MAADYFMKFESIDGESTDSAHKGSIQLASFSWGVHNNATANAGVARAGRPSFEDFHFTAHISKASPKMFIACTTGAVQKTATFSAAKAGAAQKESQDFLVIKMENVLISSYSDAAAPGDDLPMDTVSLAFARVTFTYRVQNPDGAAGAAVTESWDLRGLKQ